MIYDNNNHTYSAIIINILFTVLILAILGINLPGDGDQVQCQLRVASQSRLVVNSDDLLITVTLLTLLPMAVPRVVTPP